MESPIPLIIGISGPSLEAEQPSDPAQEAATRAPIRPLAGEMLDFVVIPDFRFPVVHPEKVSGERLDSHHR